VKKRAIGLKSWWICGCLLGLSIVLLAGCSADEVVAPTAPAISTIAAATATVAPTTTPTEVAIITPTALPAEVAVAVMEDTSADWVNIASVEGDFYIRGNPNAPLRLLDYSDFL